MTMPMPKTVARFDDEPELFAPRAPVKPVVKTVVRKVEKAPNAFRTISEVGEELDVPQHVLRFWETKFAQLRPLKRGGGRRYYRTEDVTLLRQIHGLLYGQGYTIKGAQKVLKEKAPGLSAPPADVAKEDTKSQSLSKESRAILTDMLAELKALRALV